MTSNIITISKSFKAIKSFLEHFEKIELKYHWNLLKHKLQFICILKSTIVSNNNHKYNSNSKNQSLTKAPCSSSNITEPFNMSFNKSTTTSYNNLLSKAIRDLKEDDDMFSYLHNELPKIKSPSVFQLKKSRGNYKGSDHFQYIAKKKNTVKIKTRMPNCIKKKFLINDDELSNTFKEDDNYNKININNIKESIYIVKDLIQGEKNKAQTYFGSTDNSLPWKNSIYSTHFNKVRTFNRGLNLYNFIHLSSSFEYKIIINQIKQTAHNYWRYSNLCYLIKITSLNKYGTRIALLHKIISCWKFIIKIERGQRIKNKVLQNNEKPALFGTVKDIFNNTNTCCQILSSYTNKSMNNKV